MSEAGAMKKIHEGLAALVGEIESLRVYAGKLEDDNANLALDLVKLKRRLQKNRPRPARRRRAQHK